MARRTKVLSFVGEAGWTILKQVMKSTATADSPPADGSMAAMARAATELRAVLIGLPALLVAMFVRSGCRMKPGSLRRRQPPPIAESTDKPTELTAMTQLWLAVWVGSEAITSTHKFGREA